MKMKRNLILTLFCISGFCFAQIHIPVSANLILNSSFELKQDDEEYPTDKAQADRLLNWETRTSDLIPQTEALFFHSPDWEYNQGTTSSAHSGNGHLGMTQYELIQQDMGQSPLLANRKYRLSFFYKASHDVYPWENSKISFYISKTKIRYANEPIWTGVHTWRDQKLEDYCNENYRKPSALNDIESQKILIHSEQIKPDVGNVGDWTKVSVIVQMPGITCDLEQNLCGYNWFVVQLENETAPDDVEGVFWDCEDGYVYLDDISLNDASGCEYECRVPLPEIESHPIQLSITAAGPMNPDPGWFEELMGWNDDEWTDHAWSVSLKNAIGYELEIFPRWDEQPDIMYVQTEYDVNGLKDSGYDDYYIILHGDEVPQSNPLIPFNEYVVVLFAWNCEHVARFDYTMTYIATPNLPAKAPLNQNFEPACCPDYKYIQNTTYTVAQTVKAGISIRAGNMVDPNTSVPPGNVTFSPSTGLSSPVVKYVAPNIYLEPGFFAGSQFQAILGECFNYGGRIAAMPRENYIRSNNRNRKGDATIFPNPLKSGETLSFLEEVLSAEIFSSTGALVFSGNNLSQIKSVYLNQGMYLIRFQSKQGKWITSKFSVL